MSSSYPNLSLGINEFIDSMNDGFFVTFSCAKRLHALEDDEETQEYIRSILDQKRRVRTILRKHFRINFVLFFRRFLWVRSAAFTNPNLFRLVREVSISLQEVISTIRFSAEDLEVLVMKKKSYNNIHVILAEVQRMGDMVRDPWSPLDTERKAV